MAELDSMTLGTALDVLQLHPENVLLHISKEKQLEMMCQFYPLNKHGIPRVIFSGSVAEGTTDFHSDCDYMHPFQFVHVTDKRPPAMNQRQLSENRITLLFHMIM